MTRAQAIAQILAILDGAQPPAAPVITADSSPKKKSAARRRGAESSAAVRIENSGAVAPAAVAPAAFFSTKQSPSSQTGASREHGKKEKPTHERCAGFALTDLGNAERFAARFTGEILWCAALGWLVWDGKRYTAEGAEERVKEAEHRTVRFLQDEARVLEQRAKALKPEARGEAKEEAPPSPDDAGELKERLLKRAKALRAWGVKSEANKALAVIARNAKPYLAVNVRELNADPMKLNVNNGTLVFSAELPGYIELRPHDPADRITRLCPVDYDPDAACPNYDRFLARVQPLPEMRAFLHRWMGYSLTADAGEQKFVVFYGTGRNGKGTFVELCAFIAGDYAEYIPIETFIQAHWQTSGAQARPDLMLMHNVRMVRSVEPEEGVRFNEALLKQVTGGDPVTARDLNKPMVRFRPHLKLTISVNARPDVRGTDEGIWSRIKLVPWEVFIPALERNTHLLRELQAESSGVLNRLLDGLRQWFDIGIAFPDAVERATQDYREDSDVIGQFLGEATEREEGARTQSSLLHRVLVAWQKARGDRAWSNKAMTRALLARGLRKKKSNGEWWLGLRLTRAEADYVDSLGKPRDWPGAGEDAAAAGDDIAF